MAANKAGGDADLLPFLWQENALQLLQRKGLCLDGCSKPFLLVPAELYFPWGSDFDCLNELYMYFYNYCMNSPKTLNTQFRFHTNDEKKIFIMKVWAMIKANVSNT